MSNGSSARRLRPANGCCATGSIDSTRVYQGGSGGVDDALLTALERVAVGETRPDLTVVLDLPVESGLARAAARLAASGGTPDRFERERVELHEKRRQGFLAIARAEPDRCVVIDAGGSEQDVADAIWHEVADRLLKKVA